MGGSQNYSPILGPLHVGQDNPHMGGSQTYGPILGPLHIGAVLQ